METERARVDVPLLVSHRTLLEREGPLGEAWRMVDGGNAHSPDRAWHFSGQPARDR